VGEVLKVALAREPEPIEWVEPEVAAQSSLPDSDADSVVTH
jgi:ATP-dependent Lon protease